METDEGIRRIYSTHRREMYLASGANISRSERRCSSSCFLSPYGCAHQRGTHIRKARHRKTRENVHHDHGPAVGTWATASRLSFLGPGLLSNPLPSKWQHFFPILLEVWGTHCRHHQYFGNLYHGLKYNLPVKAAPLVTNQRSFPEWEHAEGRRTGWRTSQSRA